MSTIKQSIHCTFLTRTAATVFWGVLYLMTLGFTPKYRERARFFEVLDPKSTYPDYKRYSEPPTFLGLPYVLFSKGTKEGSPEFIRPSGDSSRSSQSDEWAKLSTVLSVITATSAASLAIPGLAGPQAYWFVNVLFATALGISLEGLILVNYMAVIASCISDETIGLLVRALVLALPVVYAAYSAFFLLLGVMTMIFRGSLIIDSNTQEQAQWFRACALAPVGLGFFCMWAVFVVGELGVWKEYSRRQYNEPAAVQLSHEVKDTVLPVHVITNTAVAPTSLA